MISRQEMEDSNNSPSNNGDNNQYYYSEKKTDNNVVLIYGILRRRKPKQKKTNTSSNNKNNDNEYYVEWITHIQQQQGPMEESDENILSSSSVSKPCFIKDDKTIFSYIMYDTNGKIIQIYNNHVKGATNMDIAMILYAEKCLQQKESSQNDKRTMLTTCELSTTSLSSSDNNNDNRERTKNIEKQSNINRKRYTTGIDIHEINELVNEGILPLVPTSKSSTQQFFIQQSVNWFFHTSSVKFFACQPYRYSPRTIYRYDNIDIDDTINNCNGYIALTIDDAPCRFNVDGGMSMMPQVLCLLKQYNAKATFMCIQQYMNYETNQNDLIELLLQGHEIANHGIHDMAMDNLTEQEFETAVIKCNESILKLYQKANKRRRKQQRTLNDSCNLDPGSIQHGIKWFRAPHGKYTKNMEKVLTKFDMYNVMCDVYAVDPIVENGIWIGQSLSLKSKHGSIILIHMPENQFRSYNYQALEILLDELCIKRKYHIVTVSELERLSKKQLK